ncbi:hypothetical protein [Aliikangiella coralliicola]|uniref:DUF1579 domain-containing protein n=1 Tax=Aliikangiella coralliicola TaxID=2592383 RepID=A0A545UEA3_9GAMM|nr:hypothetical protein [Aliikangiella coralliicola]TQV87801.1 hypothetical protein FLL46_10475 [Aliikangiella coralliicola]
MNVKQLIESIDLSTSSSTDFDFILGGDRIITHRRLNERFVNCDDWSTFTSTYHAWSMMGGLANADEAHVEMPEGDFYGASVRVFNPETKLWTIFWMDSNRTKLEHQVVGAFCGKEAVFYGEDIVDGKAIPLRFIWRVKDDGTAYWEQAYFIEEANVWETNWTMDFSRLKASEKSDD